MELIEFLDGILLQDEVKEKVLELIKDNYNEYIKYADLLNVYNKAEETQEKISSIYEFDVYNYNLLSIYLLSALNVYKKYKEIGISDEIFFDTMKCFTRFINECYIKNGKYYFDRAFWTYRQTRMSIFRIGVFEYEFNNEGWISLHIPSDSILSKENIEKSLKKYAEFINIFYPDKVGCDITCGSWLLSPELKKYLGEESRILLFQKYFEITSFNPDALDIFEWVFKTTKDTPIVNLKEDTSLQRNIKKALLNGEKIGVGYGKMKKM